MLGQLHILRQSYNLAKTMIEEIEDNKNLTPYAPIAASDLGDISHLHV